MQAEVIPENIFPLVKERLYQDQSVLNDEFIAIHKTLKQNASEKAALAVIDLLTSNNKHD